MVGVKDSVHEVRIFFFFKLVSSTCQDMSRGLIVVDEPSAWNNTEKMVCCYHTTCNDWQCTLLPWFETNNRCEDHSTVPRNC